MNKKVIIFGLFTIISLASCSSDDPQWADPEAHEKTEQLREQYGSLLVGTWHLERIGHILPKRLVHQILISCHAEWRPHIFCYTQLWFIDVPILGRWLVHAL